MKRSFKLYIEGNSFSKLITSFDLNTPTQITNLASTFNEHISFQQHDQITFTFSIMKYVNDINTQRDITKMVTVPNPLLKLFTIGAKLRLVEDDTEEYHLIIKTIEPNSYKNNACYKFTCQDEVSYRWSRMKLGYSYSTINRGGPRNIYTIAQEILGECHLDQWDVITLHNVAAASEIPLLSQKITLEVTNSNPYNAIIEACNSVNAQMSVHYGTKSITFYQNDSRPFSGYRYRPELNLNSLGVNYSGENMATILHVTGGTNEYNNNISMIPYMPNMLQKCFTATTEWEKQIGHEWWYSDFMYPIYWRHLPLNTDISALKNILDNSGLALDFATDKLPPSFNSQYESYTAYIQYVITKYASIESYNAYITEMQDKYRTFYFQDQYTAQLASEVPPEYAEYYTLDEYNKNIKIQQEKELNEFNEFVQVANKQMHLGQFLFNFDFFKNSGLLSSAQYNTLHYIFNVQMRDNNIWLKIYTQHYYESIWKLNQQIIDLKSYLEQANALYRALYDKWQAGEDVTTITTEYITEAQKHLAQAQNLILNTQFQSLLNTIYGAYTYNQIPEFKDLIKEYDNYKKIRDESFIQSGAFLIQLNTFNEDQQQSPDYIQAQASYQYYKERYLTAISLCGEASNTDGCWQIAPDVRVQSTYAFIMDQLITAYNPQSNNAIGLYEKIQDYEASNNNLWDQLYLLYGQYIYEQTYENTDELDSLNLYNQAIAYYEDYNKPSANYTAEILDLGALEAIALPRLKVGYRIRVYNDYLNLNDNALNNIQFTNNELIITSIEYDLRKCQKVSIGVEQVTQYQSILQKLIKIIK